MRSTIQRHGPAGPGTPEQPPAGTPQTLHSGCGMLGQEEQEESREEGTPVTQHRTPPSGVGGANSR